MLLHGTKKILIVMQHLVVSVQFIMLCILNALLKNWPIKGKYLTIYSTQLYPWTLVESNVLLNSEIQTYGKVFPFTYTFREEIYEKRIANAYFIYAFLELNQVIL